MRSRGPMSFAGTWAIRGDSQVLTSSCMDCLRMLPGQAECESGFRSLLTLSQTDYDIAAKGFHKGKQAKDALVDLLNGGRAAVRRQFLGESVQWRETREALDRHLRTQVFYGSQIFIGQLSFILGDVSFQGRMFWDQPSSERTFAQRIEKRNGYRLFEESRAAALQNAQALSH